ncbi:hypothetical protein FRC12_022585 [Ceratobasidium sp. 428]|nr:hypothetical protein FRC12_022585 [Ceratobasidium sp. 428]
MSVSRTLSNERQRLLPDADNQDTIQTYDAPNVDTSTTSASTHPTTNTLRQKDLFWVLAGLWAAVFLGSLDTTIVATLLSPIGSYFNKSHQVSYLGTSYLLSVCCFTPLYGRLSDILGRKGAMMLGLFLFGTGTVFCGLAPSMELLILARAIAGMGGGGVFAVSSIVMTDLIPFTSYQGNNEDYIKDSQICTGIGGPLGGWINDTFGCRLQIPILVLSAVLVVVKLNVTLPQPKQTARQKLARIDYAGSFTLVTSVGCLLLGLSLKTSEDLDWSSRLILGLFFVGAISGVAFIYVEAHLAVEPIMPLNLLTRRTPLAVALANLCGALDAISTIYNVPLYFTAVRLRSAADSVYQYRSTLVTQCDSWFVREYAYWLDRSSRAMQKTGRYYHLILFSSIAMLVSYVLLASWNESTAEYHLWGDVIFNGLGIGALATSTLIALIAGIDKKEYAVATGTMYLFRTTGQVLGVSLSGALVQAVLVSTLKRGIHGPNADEIIQRIRQVQLVNRRNLH